MVKAPPTTANAFLQRARFEAGLSQRELAERAGVTQPEIARIESGNREPSIPTLQKILAGAGLELRFRLAPIDDHDRVLAARHARRSSKADNAAVEERHRRKVSKFAAITRKN
ncbi:MAG TPA: helix-turn-helix transcriptional regulator [Acidimicrobiales bacterium]|jgi:transcriptional regulator with XRE-family HTH domain